MKFKYYITNLLDGVVEGTNSDEQAAEFAKSPEFFVVNAETGVWAVDGCEFCPVSEATKIE